jgi:hypothetical protein
LFICCSFYFGYNSKAKQGETKPKKYVMLNLFQHPTC